MTRQLKANRFLPPYVTSFKDRHGKTRLRFRRKGFAPHYFAAALGTEEFRVEYRSCTEPQPSTARAEVNRYAPGTVGDLVARYLAVPARLGPTLATQAKVRAIIEKYREGRADRMVEGVRFEHIDGVVARKRVKALEGKRMVGGTEAARKLRKELVRLFDFAIKLKLRTDNPAAQAERVKVAAGERSTGFHTWTEDEIERYRAHYPLGTKARLAMELMLWTGQRRVDAIRFGRQHLAKGQIEFSQTKGGKALILPIAPQLLTAIAAMPAHGHMTFLVNEKGNPFGNPSFGNWFRDKCDAAGLPQCTAHGLRKAMMRRMAELHFGNQSLKAVSGHSGDDEVAVYTRAVDQRRMAGETIGALSDWEMSNPPTKVRHQS